MSKRAEEAALKAYPVRTYRKDQGEPEYSSDYNANDRYRFQEGYEQAEKKLEPIIQAAIRVYESWSGGTIDDVRRDMEELRHFIQPIRKQEGQE